MKKKLSVFCSMLLAIALILPTVTLPVFAEGDETSDTYTAPETPSVTYNMNLDWKFYDTNNLTNDIWTAMSVADKNGKKFYEKDYDDREWESVSIPHAAGGQKAFDSVVGDDGGGYMSILLYRKTFTVPDVTGGTKIFFELEGIRQAAYVWVNGQQVGYYEAGIAPMGFDITSFVTPGDEAVIAICNDGSATKGNTRKQMFETVPGEKWGSSYTPDNYKTIIGKGSGYIWNTKDFNEPQIGLVYDAYLHVKGDVYQTFPLYNNLKTTGNYIYATDFDIKGNKAKLNVKAEVRNESSADGNYTLEVNVVDHEGKLKYTFESAAKEVKKATDAGTVYETAVESNVYDDENIANSTGLTKVNTPDVTYIEASYDAEDVRFWSLDDPYLYTVYTVLKDSTGKAVDVQKNTTGFRKIAYDENNGILLNENPVWLKGYAQRSTNEWAVIGIAPDWLQDYDMALLKENNANFIRWMHVAPKPFEVRSSDKYGVAVVCPAGDKEGKGLTGRQWSQRTEAMRDVMIYFRNSPSVFFYETGNSAVGSAANANEMAALRDEIDPKGMRFIGARSTNTADQLNYDYNYGGTMYGGAAGKDAAYVINQMKSNNKPGPIMETEYAREESPRRVWDRFSPPDYDYVNKHMLKTDKVSKADGYDVHNLTQEEITVSNVKEYSTGYYQKRMGSGNNIFSAEAMMVWSDSNMHTRNAASENCRTSGRVDAVRQTKEMFEGTRVAQSDKNAVHIVGHWSYPAVSDDTYNYFDSAYTGVLTTEKGTTNYKIYTNTKLKRDPTQKTVYVIGSAGVKKVELYRIDGTNETLIGTDESADDIFVYQFDQINVTLGDGVIAKAYNARGEEIASDKIERTGEGIAVKLTPHTAPDGWKADGSDIAYYDVEVVDENGNVCAVNYDKIEFEWSGKGTYLGGYNSGSGTNCLQNTAASAGLSNYFGGAKDGISTIGKNYVYAENGTNRIFVKSTREAGDFTLKARLVGKSWQEAKITSEAVTGYEGGLTTEMQSTLDPGVSSERPVVRTISPLVPLMKAKWLVSWKDAVVEKVVDTNVYYDLQYNGAGVDVTDKPREGIGGFIYGPVLCIMDKLKAAGALTYTYENKVLTFVAGGHTYTVEEGGNSIEIDGGEPTEINDNAAEIGDELFVTYGAVLGYIPGIDVETDRENKVINITYTNPQ